MNNKEEQIYSTLINDVRLALSKHDHWITNLANFSAILKIAFPKISWVGFYIYDGEKLYLGPFQGKPACSTIKVGKGVCGTAAAENRTIIVEDVHKFPGHIACDSGSNSEIVAPMYADDTLLGVLDIDSYDFGAFNETDKQYLEQMVLFLIDDILPKSL